MAIAPIDLQTLFTQVDKVGKTEASQKDGQALHQAIQGARIQQEAEHQVHQVNEAKDLGEEGTDKIKDRNPGEGQSGQSGRNNKRQTEQDKEEERKASFFKEPNLGSKIDISL